MSADNEWKRFHRTGRVIARRLSQTETWRTSSGDNMTGQTGDWKLHEPDTPEECWTIVDREFRATYRLTCGIIYERTGIVEARQARSAEEIQTEEGLVNARPGDWIVRRATGFQWVVPSDKFAANYDGPDRDQPLVPMPPEDEWPTTMTQK